MDDQERKRRWREGLPIDVEQMPGVEDDPITVAEFGRILTMPELNSRRRRRS